MSGHYFLHHSIHNFLSFSQLSCASLSIALRPFCNHFSAGNIAITCEQETITQIRNTAPIMAGELRLQQPSFLLKN